MSVRRIFLVSMLGLLAACSTGAVREEVEQKSQRIEQDLEHAKEPLPPFRSNPLVVTDRIWTGSSAIRLHHGIPLPGRLESARGISFVASNTLSLQDISEALTSQIGIPVRLGLGVSSTASVSAAPVAPVGGAAVPLTADPSVMASGGGGGDSPMSLAYEGSLSGLLDQVAAHFGVNWNYDGTTIAFSKFETRVFVLEAMPGKGKFSDSVGGGGGSSGGGSSGGGGGGGGATLTQELKLESDLDVWSEIGGTINAILGGTGSAIVSPSVGTITVTTTSDVMKNVARYISEQNQRLVRQIAINIDVYTADLENEDDVNNQLTAALKSIKPFTFTGVAAPTFAGSAADMSKLTIGIINNDNASANNVLTAISKISNNVRVAQFPMTTLNNVPITRRVGKDTSYLASSSTTVDNGSSTTTLTPGTVQEGFAIQITPRLLTDGRILLQYSLNLTDLVKISSFTSNSSSVQLPEITTRVFVQQSLLRSGSTLVLAGYSQDQVSQNANGTLDPYNILLGGGIGNDKKKTLLLIAITPQELDVPPLEQP